MAATDWTVTPERHSIPTGTTTITMGIPSSSSRFRITCHQLPTVVQVRPRQWSGAGAEAEVGGALLATTMSSDRLLPRHMVPRTIMGTGMGTGAANRTDMRPPIHRGVTVAEWAGRATCAKARTS